MLAPPLDSRRPSVASCLRRRLCSGAASSCALDSGAARQLCAGGYVLAPPLDSRQPSVASCLRRRLYSSAARQLRAGAASQLGASARGVRPSPLVCVAPCTGWTAARLPGQRGLARRLCAARRGSCVLMPPSARGLRPSPLVSSPSGRQHDGAAMRWTAAQPAAARARQCATLAPRESRRPSVASHLIAVWTAAWQGGYVLAPPLNSRRPSVASRLRRCLYSGKARHSRRPSVASRPCRRLGSGEAMQLCAAARLGSCALAPPLDSRQLRVGACLSTRGVRPSPLASSPSGQRRGKRRVEQLCAGQRRG